MNQPLLLGTSDFDEIITKNGQFIDKSLFIKEFITDGAKAISILRPRRFGKSTNLSMLKSFLSLGAKASDFDRFLIGKDQELVDRHCGKYPVVYLNFKDCKGDSWEEIQNNVWRTIRKEVDRHRIDLINVNLKAFELDEPQSLAPDDKSFIQSTLQWLTQQLYKVHGQRAIVLIDEYDAPLNHAALNGYYDKASQFFGLFYSQALKDNPALEKACLMGIVEVRGSGILSGLSNLKIYSVANNKFSSFFGFTLDEVKQFLQNQGKTEFYDDVIKWYNGYQIGSQTVINPWSFLNCVSDQEFSNYWIQSSSNESIPSFLGPNFQRFLIEWFQLLFQDGFLNVSPLSTKVNYSQQNWNLESMMHFLVLTGYLTYEKNEVGQGGIVRIPNLEIQKQWNSDIVQLVEKRFFSQFHDMLYDVLFSETFDPTVFNSILQDMLMYCSSHDLSMKYENSYHVFFFGIFLVLLHGDKIKVNSNRESESGRSEIQIILDSQKKCFVIEFKRSETKAQMDKDSQKALDKIISKSYAHDQLILNYQCFLIGVACNSKEISQLKFRRMTKQEYENPKVSQLP